MGQLFFKIETRVFHAEELRAAYIKTFDSASLLNDLAYVDHIHIILSYFTKAIINK